MRRTPQGRRRRHRGGVGVPGRRGGQGALLWRPAGSSPSLALGRTPSGSQARARQVLPPHLPFLPSQDRGRWLRAARHPRGFASQVTGPGRGSHPDTRGLRGELGEEKGTSEYAIKQVGDRYYPVIVDREAGGHYEIKNPLTGGVLSYNNPEAAEKYIQRARDKR